MKSSPHNFCSISHADPRFKSYDTQCILNSSAYIINRYPLSLAGRMIHFFIPWADRSIARSYMLMNVFFYIMFDNYMEKHWHTQSLYNTPRKKYLNNIIPWYTYQNITNIKRSLRPITSRSLSLTPKILSRGFNSRPHLRPSHRMVGDRPGMASARRRIRQWQAARSES